MVAEFNDIALTSEELELLQALKVSPVACKDDAKTLCARLVRFELAEKFRRMDVGATNCLSPDESIGLKITDKGNDFLIYLESKKIQDQEEAERDNLKTKQQFRHDWLIAIFSAISGAILSRPVWIGIDWFLNGLNWLADVVSEVVQKLSQG